MKRINRTTRLKRVTPLTFSRFRCFGAFPLGNSGLLNPNEKYVNEPHSPCINQPVVVIHPKLKQKTRRTRLCLVPSAEQRRHCSQLQLNWAWIWTWKHPSRVHLLKYWTVLLHAPSQRIVFGLFVMVDHWWNALISSF